MGGGAPVPPPPPPPQFRTPCLEEVERQKNLLYVSSIRESVSDVIQHPHQTKNK